MADDNGELAERFVARIKARLWTQNKNWLAIVCGETGSGKSYSALSLGSKIGRLHLVFSPIEFLQLLNSQKLARGDCIIFDEAGVGMAARQWYSIQNQLLGSILQTFRNMNLACIFTTPNLSFIDVQARKLFHCYMETAYIDFEESMAFLKVYQIQVNSRLDKIYYKCPKFFDERGSVLTLTMLGLEKPDDKLVEYYESRKSRFTQNLNRNALERFKEQLNKGKGMKGGGLGEPVDEDKIVSAIVANRSTYYKTYNKREFIDHLVVSNNFNISIHKAQRIVKLIQNMPKIQTNGNAGSANIIQRTNNEKGGGGD